MAKPIDSGIAVITGATGGLGPVVARALARKGGYRLALLARDAARLDELIAGLPGGPHLAVPVDLGSARDAARAADRVAADLGTPRALAHLVGSSLYGKHIAETTVEDWNAMLRVNLWAAVHAYRQFLPLLVAASDPRIVAISTPFAAKPAPTNAAYATSKAALETLTMAAGRELGAVGGSANVIVVRAILGAEDKGPGTPAKAIASTIVRLFAPGSDEGAVTGRRIDLT